MRVDYLGQIVLDQNDLIDYLMQGYDLFEIKSILVESTVDLSQVEKLLEKSLDCIQYQNPNLTVEEFDQQCQKTWHMPEEYYKIDIAEYILSLCDTEDELQRCGQELLLFQEKGLFNLLKYLKFLVDTMKKHNIIWGVGRGSSVASFVLYKLEVHRINSLYYDLDINEFLR
jgi:DNA polymerase III alpha subunit